MAITYMKYYLFSCIAILIVLGGCTYKRITHPVPTIDTIPIPNEIPDRYISESKDGQSVTVDGKLSYAKAYQFGWQACLRLADQNFDQLRDQDAGPISMQETPLTTRGRTDGFLECRRLLLSD